MNDILQYTAVGIALIICVIWIVKRIRSRKSGDCCSPGTKDTGGCSDCPLARKCKSPHDKNC